MSTSSNHGIPAELEARPAANFQTEPINSNANGNLDEHPEVAALRRAFEESVAISVRSYQALRTTNLLLEKMDQILAIVDAMKKEREEREAIRKSLEKGQEPPIAEARQPTRRPVSRRRRRTK